MTLTVKNKPGLSLAIGNFLFKYRSFTPVPLIVLVFVLFKPGNFNDYNFFVNLAGLFISAIGEWIRIMAVGYSFPGTSGRESFLRADYLNTSGIYSLTRNPLYIGNFFIFTGLVIVFANPLAVLLFALFLIMQYYFIILSEENFLRQKYGTAYDSYCLRVRRLWPTFSNYSPNQNPFNGQKVIFKEKDSVFNTAFIFLLVIAYKERFFSGRLDNLFVYALTGGMMIAVYVVVKILKKRWLPDDSRKPPEK